MALFRAISRSMRIFFQFGWPSLAFSPCWHVKPNSKPSPLQATAYRTQRKLLKLKMQKMRTEIPRLLSLPGCRERQLVLTRYKYKSTKQEEFKISVKIQKKIVANFFAELCDKISTNSLDKAFSNCASFTGHGENLLIALLNREVKGRSKQK